MGQFLPFALPEIGEEEINEVVDSLKSGWLTTGPKTKQFEQDFATFIGREVDAIAVNSATSGLHLALEALGIGVGDEVITTPYTFTATAEVIRYLGANPVFVDIDPATFNIDSAKIEAAITSKTKAIVPVHFGGLACEMQPILDLAQKYNLKVVEDAAHALPTTYQKNTIGSLDTDATVYSFYATKPIATGEGGMLVTRHPEIAKRCRVMRLHGISRDAFDRYTSTKPAWHYEVIAPGFKYNMTDLAASLGIHQLKKAWKLQQKRAEIAKYYDEHLTDLPLLLPPQAKDGDLHSWHLYVIRLTEASPISRESFIEQMANRGIGCSVHYIPLHLHPYWRDTYHLKPEDFPAALSVYQGSVSLPIYTKMTEADRESVIKAVREILA
ncbi:MAG: DegT/DnrJ/EryC1/StrS family aminotransferase [Hydrococcus sp. RU_2_2]|jgi:dTDP-4-amino-4,6-dideoxygalactose transaminase|nr:DegT/DnrJ/EryC1/StrS family aminotransferase [Hydrococcus sp. RU_2_2]NJP18373.1 DegT/DnrJ/EryC1/StrS family aminotransferase [Hydrococcus sp. CRU_1_1]